MSKHSNESLDCAMMAFPQDLRHEPECRSDPIPVGSPVPIDVIMVKISLIRRAMQLGDEEKALAHVKQAFEEAKPQEKDPGASLIEIGISEKICNMLDRFSIRTIDHVKRVGYDKLKTFPYIGPKAVEEIRSKIEEWLKPSST